jgi:hypothetical protein
VGNGNEQVEDNKIDNRINCAHNRKSNDLFNARLFPT